MERAGLNQQALALALGKQKGQVSRALSGAHNMTLNTLGDMLWACNAEVRNLELAPLGVIDVSTDDADQWDEVQTFDAFYTSTTVH